MRTSAHLCSYQDKIRTELTEKKKKQETAMAIARSSAINRARMQAVEARQNAMVEIFQQQLARAGLLADALCNECRNDRNENRIMNKVKGVSKVH